MNLRSSPKQTTVSVSSKRWLTLSLTALSIRHRLPLLIGLLLVVTFATSGIAAYRAVKESAFELARERLATLVNYLGPQLQQQSALMSTRTATSANDSAVRAFLRSPSPATRDGAITSLKQLVLPQDLSNLKVEIWNHHALILSIPEAASPASNHLQTEFEQSSREPFKSVGAIRILDGTPAYPVVAATKDEAGKPLGYLVRWRKLSGSPEARKQLTDIVGNQAVVYMGNASGEVWSDLVSATAKPEVSLAGLKDVSQYERNGEPIMGMGRPISGTPWFMVIEFPTRPLLAQPNAFLRRMIFASLVVLALGIAASVLLSRNITKPLQSLTHAALAISAGDYSQSVDADRADELGTLGKVFNTMVVKVRDSHEKLEERVADRTAQLQAANKELEAFSYSVSHDLRAPLRHINGFSQALLEDYEDKLDEAGKGYLHEVRGASQEMAQLIDDVLQLARVTRSEMRREEVDLSDLARTVAADLKKRNGRQGVTVKIEEGLAARGDKRLLRVVLTNLLDNAWKFTSKQDNAEILVGSEEKNGEVVYFVRDNGAGFDMAFVKKLFGAFQRLHGAGEFEGTGIGLATVQRIINRHGGRVWAEGSVNAGATFCFTLPGSKGDS